MIVTQFIRFCLIGTISTAVNYGLYYALCEWTAAHYLLASAIGFLAGTLISYYLNKLWTFRVAEKTVKYLYKFLSVYICSLFAGLLCLRLLVGAGINEKLAGLLIIAVTTAINFLGSKFWIFKV